MKIIQAVHIDLVNGKLVGTDLSGDNFKMQYVKSFSFIGDRLIVNLENCVKDFRVQVEGISIEGKTRFAKWLEKCEIEKK